MAARQKRNHRRWIPDRAMRTPRKARPSLFGPPDPGR
jgi:hypothetical protein